jgi:hypothetical protein
MARGTIKRQQIDCEGAGNIATDMEVATMISGSFPPGLFFESFPAQLCTTNSGIDSANRIKLRPIYLSFRVNVLNVYFAGVVANAGKVHDFGLYDSNGKLKVHTGAVAVTAGLNTIPVSQLLILPGLYYIAFTSFSITATLKSCVPLLYSNQIPTYGYLGGGGNILPNSIYLGNIIGSLNSQPWVLFTSYNILG